MGAMDGIDAIKNGEIQAEVTMQPTIKTASPVKMPTPEPEPEPEAEPEPTTREPNTQPEPEPEPESKAQASSAPQVPPSGAANSAIFKSYIVALLVACQSSIDAIF